MDSYEATRLVLSRIQSLEPDNATKIMGYLFLKNYSEKDIVRFALGPDTLLHNLIYEAKTQLGIPTKSPSTPSSPSPLVPISRPNPLSLSSFFSSSPRITTNAFDFTNPSSPSSNTRPISGFPASRSPNNLPISPSSFPSYASVLSRNSETGSGSGCLSPSKVCSFSTGYNSSVTHDEYLFQNDLSFLNNSKVDDLYVSRLHFASNPDTNCNDLHNNYPVTLLGAEDLNSGFGWKPCLYFARGFCKNGSTCRFLHEDSTADGAAIVGSPSNNHNDLEQWPEFLRLKSAAQRQYLNSELPFVTGTSFPYNSYLNLLMQQVDNQRSATNAFGGNVNPASRQIYLTFPADSTFKEEDVSSYFSLYGPVQDVRIPYQQKRMFGFVSFVYPETVNLILAKGNPHFVCDSRVLVKPYKEKGKLLEKKQYQQQLEKGDYSLCSSPTTLNCRDSYDHGARMFCNAKETLLMKKLEERAIFQQAIDLQERRLMNLQLLDLKHNSYHRHQHRHDFSSGSPIPCPTMSRTLNHQASEEGDVSAIGVIPQTDVIDGDKQQQLINLACNPNGVNEDKSCKEYLKTEQSELYTRMEHLLPDNLFASPENPSGDNTTVFSSASIEVETEDGSIKRDNFSSSSNNNSDFSSSSTLNVASPKSVFSKCPGYLLGMEPLECS